MTEELKYPTRRYLPVLYGKDKAGRERMWKVWVEDSTIHKMYGLVDGKKVSSKRAYSGNTVLSPKKQAWAEANKTWIKQLDKSYLPKADDEDGADLLSKVNVEKEMTGGHNINSVAAAGGRKRREVKRSTEDTLIVNGLQPVIPMKAAIWELQDETNISSVKKSVLKHFDSKFYLQPKLDGWRARITIHDGRVTISSNSGKQYPWFKKVREIIQPWLENADKSLYLDGLDGELYAHEFWLENGLPLAESQRFSTIQSICSIARTLPHELESQIQFHWFDILDLTKTITRTFLSQN